MATTTYKGLELQVTGTNNNTWGDTLNTDVINRIDQNLGGIVTKSLTNVNVSLTTDEARQAILRLTGTLTGNVQITSACQGFYFVENLCTLGAFAVTVTNGVSGVTAPAGRSTMVADATNGARVASTATFPTGTAMTFYQNTAPTGWTKSATTFDHAIRLTSGTGGTTGGTTDFSTVFTARTIARANLPNDTVSVTIVDPGHTHTVAGVVGTSSTGLSGGGNSAPVSPTSTSAASNTTGITGSIALNGGVTQTTFDLATKFVNVILCTKD